MIYNALYNGKCAIIKKELREVVLWQRIKKVHS